MVQHHRWLLFQPEEVSVAIVLFSLLLTKSGECLSQYRLSKKCKALWDGRIRHNLRPFCHQVSAPILILLFFSHAKFPKRCAAAWHRTSYQYHPTMRDSNRKAITKLVVQAKLYRKIWTEIKNLSRPTSWSYQVHPGVLQRVSAENVTQQLC